MADNGETYVYSIFDHKDALDQLMERTASILKGGKFCLTDALLHSLVEETYGKKYNASYKGYVATNTPHDVINRIKLKHSIDFINNAISSLEGALNLWRTVGEIMRSDPKLNESKENRSCLDRVGVILLGLGDGVGIDTLGAEEGGRRALGVLLNRKINEYNALAKNTSKTFTTIKEKLIKKTGSTEKEGILDKAKNLLPSNPFASTNQKGRVDSKYPDNISLASLKKGKNFFAVNGLIKGPEEFDKIKKYIVSEAAISYQSLKKEIYDISQENLETYNKKDVDPNAANTGKDNVVFSLELDKTMRCVYNYFNALKKSKLLEERLNYDSKVLVKVLEHDKDVSEKRAEEVLPVLNLVKGNIVGITELKEKLNQFCEDIVDELSKGQLDTIENSVNSLNKKKSRSKTNKSISDEDLLLIDELRKKINEKYPKQVLNDSNSVEAENNKDVKKGGQIAPQKKGGAFPNLGIGAMVSNLAPKTKGKWSVKNPFGASSKSKGNKPEQNGSTAKSVAEKGELLVDVAGLGHAESGVVDREGDNNIILDLDNDDSKPTTTGTLTSAIRNNGEPESLPSVLESKTESGDVVEDGAAKNGAERGASSVKGADFEHADDEVRSRAYTENDGMNNENDDASNESGSKVDWIPASIQVIQNNGKPESLPLVLERNIESGSVVEDGAAKNGAEEDKEGVGQVKTPAPPLPPRSTGSGDVVKDGAAKNGAEKDTSSDKGTDLEHANDEVGSVGHAETDSEGDNTSDLFYATPEARRASEARKRGIPTSSTLIDQETMGNGLASTVNLKIAENTIRGWEDSINANSIDNQITIIERNARTDYRNKYLPAFKERLKRILKINPKVNNIDAHKLEKYERSLFVVEKIKEKQKEFDSNHPEEAIDNLIENLTYTLSELRSKPVRRRFFGNNEQSIVDLKTRAERVKTNLQNEKNNYEIKLRTEIEEQEQIASGEDMAELDDLKYQLSNEGNYKKIGGSFAKEELDEDLINIDSNLKNVAKFLDNCKQPFTSEKKLNGDEKEAENYFLTFKKQAEKEFYNKYKRTYWKKGELYFGLRNDFATKKEQADFKSIETTALAIKKMNHNRDELIKNIEFLDSKLNKFQYNLDILKVKIQEGEIKKTFIGRFIGYLNSTDRKRLTRIENLTHEIKGLIERNEAREDNYNAFIKSKENSLAELKGLYDEEDLQKWSYQFANDKSKIKMLKPDTLSEHVLTPQKEIKAELDSIKRELNNNPKKEKNIAKKQAEKVYNNRYGKSYWQGFKTLLFLRKKVKKETVTDHKMIHVADYILDIIEKNKKDFNGGNTIQSKILELDNTLNADKDYLENLIKKVPNKTKIGRIFNSRYKNRLQGKIRIINDNLNIKAGINIAIENIKKEYDEILQSENKNKESALGRLGGNEALKVLDKELANSGSTAEIQGADPVPKNELTQIEESNIAIEISGGNEALKDLGKELASSGSTAEIQGADLVPKNELAQREESNIFQGRSGGNEALKDLGKELASSGSTDGIQGADPVPENELAPSKVLDMSHSLEEGPLEEEFDNDRLDANKEIQNGNGKEVDLQDGVTSKEPISEQPELVVTPSTPNKNNLIGSSQSTFSFRSAAATIGDYNMSNTTGSDLDLEAIETSLGKLVIFHDELIERWNDDSEFFDQYNIKYQFPGTEHEVVHTYTEEERIHIHLVETELRVDDHLIQFRSETEYVIGDLLSLEKRLIEHKSRLLNENGIAQKQDKKPSFVEINLETQEELEEGVDDVVETVERLLRLTTRLLESFKFLHNGQLESEEKIDKLYLQRLGAAQLVDNESESSVSDEENKLYGPTRKELLGKEQFQMLDQRFMSPRYRKKERDQKLTSKDLGFDNASKILDRYEKLVRSTKQEKSKMELANTDANFDEKYGLDSTKVKEVPERFRVAHKNVVRSREKYVELYNKREEFRSKANGIIEGKDPVKAIKTLIDVCDAEAQKIWDDITQIENKGFFVRLGNFFHLINLEDKLETIARIIYRCNTTIAALGEINKSFGKSMEDTLMIEIHNLNIIGPSNFITLDNVLAKPEYKRALEYKRAPENGIEVEGLFKRNDTFSSDMDSVRSYRSYDSKVEYEKPKDISAVIKTEMDTSSVRPGTEAAVADMDVPASNGDNEVVPQPLLSPTGGQHKDAAIDKPASIADNGVRSLPPLPGNGKDTVRSVGKVVIMGKVDQNAIDGLNNDFDSLKAPKANGKDTGDWEVKNYETFERFREVYNSDLAKCSGYLKEFGFQDGDIEVLGEYAELMKASKEGEDHGEFETYQEKLVEGLEEEIDLLYAQYFDAGLLKGVASPQDERSLEGIFKLQILINGKIGRAREMVQKLHKLKDNGKNEGVDQAIWDRVYNLVETVAEGRVELINDASGRLGELKAGLGNPVQNGTEASFEAVKEASAGLEQVKPAQNAPVQNGAEDREQTMEDKIDAVKNEFKVKFGVLKQELTDKYNNTFGRSEKPQAGPGNPVHYNLYTGPEMTRIIDKKLKKPFNAVRKDREMFRNRTEHLGMPIQEGYFGMRPLVIKMENKLRGYTYHTPFVYNKKTKADYDACRALVISEILPKLTKKYADPFESQETLGIIDGLLDKAGDHLDRKALKVLKDIFFRTQVKISGDKMKKDLSAFRKRDGGSFLKSVFGKSRPGQMELESGFAQIKSYRDWEYNKLCSGDSETWRRFLANFEQIKEVSNAATDEFLKNFDNARYFMGDEKLGAIFKVLGRNDSPRSFIEGFTRDGGIAVPEERDTMNVTAAADMAAGQSMSGDISMGAAEGQDNSVPDTLAQAQGTGAINGTQQRPVTEEETAEGVRSADENEVLTTTGNPAGAESAEGLQSATPPVEIKGEGTPLGDDQQPPVQPPLSQPTNGDQEAQLDLSQLTTPLNGGKKTSVNEKNNGTNPRAIVGARQRSRSSMGV